MLLGIRWKLLMLGPWRRQDGSLVRCNRRQAMAVPAMWVLNGRNGVWTR
jgi:hypothetical protein